MKKQKWKASNRLRIFDQDLRLSSTHPAKSPRISGQGARRSAAINRKSDTTREIMEIIVMNFKSLFTGHALCRRDMAGAYWLT